MAQEPHGTGGETIRSRLEHGYQVTHFGLGQLHAVAQEVERCAERPYYGRGLCLLRPDPVEKYSS